MEKHKTQSDVTLFGETNFRGQSRKFGIRTDDRRRHMYVVGKTGMGKTTMLENMVISDIKAGNGVCVVDPHGEFADRMLDYVPASRINDVVYFNPGDVNNPIAFNVMENIDPDHKHLVASGLLGVFKKIWADSWGPRLEYVLRNTILALMDYPGSTLLGIMKMLTDKTFRNKVVKKVTDPVVKSFWIDEFSKYPDRFMAEAIAPIQNKVGQFLSISLIRNIVGQSKSTLDMRDIMDNRKILLLNLAKGRVGEDASALFGAMVITKIQLAAMSRVDIPEEERADFYLYVDEFQNFATESFADILSEARKYHLDLIMAHQYIDQLAEEVRYAVFGNVGTIVCFRIGAADAEVLVKEFEPIFDETDLVNLTKYRIYLKLMIEGVASQAFSAMTLPPLWETEGNRDKIVEISRERYAKKRDVVEDKIARWSGVMEEESEEKKIDRAPADRDRRPKDRSITSNRSSQPSPDTKVHQPFKKAFATALGGRNSNQKKATEPAKVDSRPSRKSGAGIKPGQVVKINDQRS
ncbi:type IV secretion system DNA-binding domain-containing protein [Patescibacteria group bacterium]|nr:type IV secretion system DNA-binding domain-containing protein [Patescibacteria group bacterium]